MVILCTQDISPEEAARIRSAAPEANLVIEPDQKKAQNVSGNAEIAFGYVGPELFQAAPRLRWVQLGSAGVDYALYPEICESDVLLTSSAGVFNVPIAEHLLAMILAFTRSLPRFRDRQREHDWTRDWKPDELEGKTLGIVGMGEIGEELARKVGSLGVRVIGIKRTVPPEPPPGVEWIRGMDALLNLARESDHLVDCLPNTPATRQIINREVFAAMKPTAYFYNIGRGVTVEGDALLDALKTGEIAGAGLDVTDPEPLPSDSPLWAMENVLLTPHVSGASPRTRERQVDHFVENLKRFLAGQPLKSVVDKDAGY